MERRLTRHAPWMVHATAMIGLLTGCSASTNTGPQENHAFRPAEHATSIPQRMSDIPATLAHRPTARLLIEGVGDVQPVSYESDGARDRTAQGRSIEFSDPSRGKSAAKQIVKPSAKQTPSLVPPEPRQIADLPIEVEKFFSTWPVDTARDSLGAKPERPAIRRFKGLATDRDRDGIRFHEMEMLQAASSPEGGKKSGTPTSPAPDLAEPVQKSGTKGGGAARSVAATPTGRRSAKGALWDDPERGDTKAPNLDLAPDQSADGLSAPAAAPATDDSMVAKKTDAEEEEGTVAKGAVVESFTAPQTIVNPYQGDRDRTSTDESTVADQRQTSEDDPQDGLKKTFRDMLAQPNRAGLPRPRGTRSGRPRADKIAENQREATPPAPAHSRAEVENSRDPQRERSLSALPTSPPAADAFTQGLPPITISAEAARMKLRMVTQQANRHIRYAFDLGRKGAIYSARAEFIKALRIVAHSLDEAYGTRDRGQALAEGLTALAEAEDFMLRDAALAANLDVGAIVGSHQTSVLQGQDMTHVGPFRAIQTYYEYAKGRLAYAGGSEPAASIAVYGLARTESRIAGEESVLGGPKAIALHQAAVIVDPNNYLAANQLGVLFAKYGQLEKAKMALVRSLEIKAHPRTWSNLAVVSSRLGDEDLAAHASRNARQGISTDRPAQVADTRVQWVDFTTFQARSGAEPVLARRPQTPRPNVQAKQQVKAKESRFLNLPFGVRAKNESSGSKSVIR